MVHYPTCAGWELSRTINNPALSWTKTSDWIAHGSVLGTLSSLIQSRGFDPPLRRSFPGRGYFSLGVNMGSDHIPQKSLSDESINRGLVCAHMHSITPTQKVLTFMSWTGECRQQKHTQHAPSTKMGCDYLNGWIKKQYTKISPKMVNPRDPAGNAEEKEEKELKQPVHSSVIEMAFLLWQALCINCKVPCKRPTPP